MKKSIALLALVSVMLLSACSKSSVLKQNKLYLKKSHTIAPLVVPAGVPNIKQRAYYPVPHTIGHYQAKPVSLVPPTFAH